MLHQIKWISLLLLGSVIFFFTPMQIAAETEDGYYEIDYEVLNADNDSVSMANDYFEKPAVLIVDGDDRKVQMLINYSQWVVGLQAPHGDDFEEVEVLSEDKSDEEKEKRIVQFDLKDNQDFTEPIEMKMHIVVDVLEEDYDHQYTARFDFDESSLEEVDTPLFEAEEGEEQSDESNEATTSDNKEKDDESSTDTASEEEPTDAQNAGLNSGTMIVILLLGGIAIILIYSFVIKKKK